MKSFIMKALTRNGSGWYTFSIEEIPCLITTDLFTLMAVPNSPVLRLDTIRRGDRDTLLFEGEVVECDGDRWMICYERGFYAINSLYVIRQLSTLKNVHKIGDVNYNIEFPVPISIKQKLLFKYKSTIFRLEAICGCYNNQILIRAQKRPIDPKTIKQDCGCELDKNRLYLGDSTPYGITTMHEGVLGFEQNKVFRSISEVRG